MNGIVTLAGPPAWPGSLKITADARPDQSALDESAERTVLDVLIVVQVRERSELTGVAQA